MIALIFAALLAWNTEPPEHIRWEYQSRAMCSQWHHHTDGERHEEMVPCMTTAGRSSTAEYNHALRSADEHALHTLEVCFRADYGEMSCIRLDPPEWGSAWEVRARRHPSLHPTLYIAPGVGTKIISTTE